MSSVCMASLKPPLTGPTRASLSTRQSVNVSVASGCGAITWMCALLSRPGASALTMKALMPRAPASGSVLAKTTWKSAMPPLLIQVFWPFSVQPVGVGVARSAMAATSEPASGSLSAKAAIFLPLATAGR